VMGRQGTEKWPSGCTGSVHRRLNSTAKRNQGEIVALNDAHRFPSEAV
jgi:hypothetical protein